MTKSLPLIKTKTMEYNRDKNETELNGKLIIRTRNDEKVESFISIDVICIGLTPMVFFYYKIPFVMYIYTSSCQLML